MPNLAGLSSTQLKNNFSDLSSASSLSVKCLDMRVLNQMDQKNYFLCFYSQVVNKEFKIMSKSTMWLVIAWGQRAIPGEYRRFQMEMTRRHHTTTCIYPCICILLYFKRWGMSQRDLKSSRHSLYSGTFRRKEWRFFSDASGSRGDWFDEI